MLAGWVRFHRKITQWEWYTEPNVFRVFFHLIVLANHKDNTWRGIEVKRGQLITSYSKLAVELELSVQQIRTVLDKLELTHEITRQSTSKYTVVTIENYNEYQNKEQDINKQDNTQDNKQITNNQQGINKQITTNKNDKNDKNENNDNISMASRQKNFVSLVTKFVKENPKYRKVKNQFISHWTEPNKTNTKFRREEETYFNLKKRLDIFLNNSESRKNKFEKQKNDGIYREKNYASKF